MANATLKPTFIHLGPIVCRRKCFVAVREEDDQLKVFIGQDGSGMYTEYLKDEEDIKDFWKDFDRHQSEGRL